MHQKGAHPRPPRSPKPRARATDHRAEDGRGQGSRSGTRQGAARPKARRRTRRAEARGRPRGRIAAPCRPKRPGPREPPRQGAKGAAVRKKDGGHKADGQAAVQCKRTGDPKGRH